MKRTLTRDEIRANRTAVRVRALKLARATAQDTRTEIRDYYGGAR